MAMGGVPGGDQVFKVGKQAFSLFGEFQNFAFKGNVIDLAVGVIIGGAFGKIVESLVKNIFMPLINLVLPGESGYESWAITINNKSIPIGLFLGDVVNFLIVAFALFLFIVKFLGWLNSFVKQKVNEAGTAPPPLTKEQELLTEIRDLLKTRD
jgi:large conductance mechanosensitive channel